MKRTEKQIYQFNRFMLKGFLCGLRTRCLQFLENNLLSREERIRVSNIKGLAEAMISNFDKKDTQYGKDVI